MVLELEKYSTEDVRKTCVECSLGTREQKLNWKTFYLRWNTDSCYLFFVFLRQSVDCNDLKLETSIFLFKGETLFFFDSERVLILTLLLTEPFSKLWALL